MVRPVQAALFAQCFQGFSRLPSASIDTPEYVKKGPDQTVQADFGLRSSNNVKEPLGLHCSLRDARIHTVNTAPP